ncbi:MAG: hypothetical protein A3K14_08190 [Sulfurimonas sp. RIFCSPLOWO2_12_FULL_36_74]|uniref:hypothetical protein n=1 Tax=Sulfurimonas sp. RIFCSPLOWO2_12_36_12 TaxID=1802253 RepID=UPI0008CCB794|nr:hypothetical protein [Sulfurimonas sp. RIFCSPLOWO2_12_36_12]OHD98959.1 MAG: hypothetical protein A3J26_06425 [Sulfurimonas sp. RIFCSPLOWO2_02_FULL_36_28]OHE02605.1 MAG: hypothetical protein A2W82_05870 [Sulfurimonas sp. RIFCSPLOWO2_12_36_12]OHE03556.1 MAG: hypothetical protein A3K14_08190 [Sulfurimonas sp. RIFCSPLOWO2_12_FULL_36_74]
MIRLYIFTLLLPIVLFSDNFSISNIPLPISEVQNMDPVQEKLLEKTAPEHLSVSNSKPAATGNKLRIALLLPHNTIGRYAASTANASFAYLVSKNRPFELKSYKIEDESYEEILKTLNKIQADGFSYVIAPLTQTGEKIVSKINPQINIYFPTINKKDTQTTSKYLYYGGIDYRAQSDLLLNESVSPLVVFYDKSEIGEQLSKYQEYAFKQRNGVNKNSVVKISIPLQITSLENQLKNNSKIAGGSFFVNTPIVKSGMIMSQLTLYDVDVTNVLSTQTNYNPLLLSMTQYQDRKNMIIANSITQNNDVLIETNSILGNDIVYDWINYTTTVGIDYFSYIINGQKREYDIENLNNQMIYPIKLLQPSVSKFIPYKSSSKE